MLALLFFRGGGGEEAVASSSPARTYWAGFIPPKRKRKKAEPPAVVEIAVETIKQEKIVKYVEIRQPVFGPSVVPVMQAIEGVTKLIEARARSAEIQRKILEVEEEENIIIILSQLQ